jgi:hypothetical protein
VELVDADALLVPVDGRLCKLGGAPASALRAALPADDRDDELEYVEHELDRMRPLAPAQARAIDGVARWRHLVVVAAYPHDVDGVTYSPDDCARLLRPGLAAAFAVAEAAGARTIGATLIGTAYRMPADLAVRAFVDGAAAAREARDLIVRWSLPEPAHRALAEVAARRLALLR